MGNRLRLSTGHPEGRAGARKPPPRYSAHGSRPAEKGVAKPPQSPQGSRLCAAKCSESTSRRKWQNGAMAHFAILRVQAQVRGRCPSLHEARLQSAGHAERSRRAVAHNEHFGAHSVAEGMAAFRARLPESFRKDAVQAIEYLMTASPESHGQQEPGRAGCVFPGRAGLAEGSPWRGKRGLCRHPPGRDHAAHAPTWCRETQRLDDSTPRGGWVVLRRCGTCKPVCGAGRQAAWPRKGSGRLQIAPYDDSGVLRQGGAGKRQIARCGRS